MVEAYYEEIMPIVEGMRYPFHSFIADTKGKSLKVAPHWHYYIELLFFIQGSAAVILGNNRYEMSSGDFAIINSREVHSVCSQEGVETRYIVIKFDVDVLFTSDKAVFEAKYILPFTMAQYQNQEVFRKNELKNSPVEALVNKIYGEYTDKKYGFELAVRINISSLFLWIIRNWEEKGIKVELQNIPKEIDIQKLQETLDYLDVHYAEEITVEDMAKMCSVSYSYFSRYFKKVMKKTFTEYLNHIRIIEAKTLLLTTEMNITEIALRTGFNNSSYFIEQFKRYNNQSPKQFKMKALRGI